MPETGEPLLNRVREPAAARWVALLAGMSLVLAFAPFGLYWLPPIALAILLWLIDPLDPRTGARIGFFFSLGTFVAGTWWLYISLNILGGLWPPFAVLLMLGLVLIMSCYGALTAWLMLRLTVPGSLRWLVVFPAVWTLLEWLRGWVLSGFPWMSLGYSQVDSPLGAIAPVAGVYGVSWLVALLAGFVCGLLFGSARQRLHAVLANLLVVAVVTLAASVDWTGPAGDALQVRLVQGAVPQEEKWKADNLMPTLDLYRELSQSDDPLDLIIWPEAAIPALQFEVSDYVDKLHAEMVDRETQLLTGMLKFDIERDEFLNTLWAFGAETGEYHKRHLVPFGEYFPVPAFVRKVMRLMNLPSEDISPGGDDQLPLLAKGVPIAPTICYEAAYGAEQNLFFPAAQLMVNISNDAWFGDTIAPHQHLQINRFRSLETGRYMLRATNTGLTAVIDPRGRVIGALPQFEPGALDATVIPQSGSTPYMRFGNWLIVIVLLSLLGIAAAARRFSP